MLLRPPFQLPQTLDFLEYQFQLLLASNDIQMLADSGIFASEPFNLGLIEVPAKPNVQFSGEVVVEFGEELDVEEEHSCRSQFIGNNVQKHLRAIVFVLEIGALLRLDSHEPHLDDLGSVAEKHSFSTCITS